MAHPTHLFPSLLLDATNNNKRPSVILLLGVLICAPKLVASSSSTTTPPPTIPMSTSSGDADRAHIAMLPTPSTKRPRGTSVDGTLAPSPSFLSDPPPPEEESERGANPHARASALVVALLSSPHSSKTSDHPHSMEDDASRGVFGDNPRHLRLLDQEPSSSNSPSHRPAKQAKMPNGSAAQAGGGGGGRQPDGYTSALESRSSPAPAAGNW